MTELVLNLFVYSSLVDTEGVERESLIVSADDLEGEKDEEEEEVDTTLINTRTADSVSVANGNNSFSADRDSTTQAYTNTHSITDHV